MLDKFCQQHRVQLEKNLRKLFYRTLERKKKFYYTVLFNEFLVTYALLQLEERKRETIREKESDSKRERETVREREREREREEREREVFLREHNTFFIIVQYTE